MEYNKKNDNKKQFINETIEEAKKMKNKINNVFKKWKNKDSDTTELNKKYENKIDVEDNVTNNGNCLNNNSDKIKEYTIILKKIAFWGIAIFLWIMGLCFIKKYIPITISSFLLGIIACPKSNEELKKYNFYKNNKILFIIVAIIIWIVCVGSSPTTENQKIENVVTNTENTSLSENEKTNNYINIKEIDNTIESEEITIVDTTNKISLKEIPEFNGTPYVEINGNIPYFDDSELITEAYEKYSDLDNLGRAGIAVACIEKGMDDKPRESVSRVTPTGWKDTKYDGIDGSNLFNRCHIIANQLTGENDNEKNLMTGTRYFNTQGMERFENQVAEYVNNTENHVLYRVTPMFDDNDLVAKGVLIEAKSVEDNGKGIQFNAFCYNVQPGIEIDYSNGNSKKIEEQREPEASTAAAATTAVTTVINSENRTEQNNEAIENNTLMEVDSSTKIESETAQSSVQVPVDSTQQTYILNTNSKKFHYPWCSSVNQMKDKNKREYTGTRESVVSKGYQPCGRCSP